MSQQLGVLFHPAVIHFPIALLLVGSGLAFVATRRPDDFLERSGYGALLLGWWSTLVAIATGVLAVTLTWPLENAELGWVNAHAVSGTAVLLIYGRALLQRRRDAQILYGAGRRGYLLLLGLGALLVLVSGWTGGHLVYTLGLGVQ